MTTNEQMKTFLNGQEKIRVSHLDRAACIYLRQSTPGQVLYNRESLVNQERMADRAQLLGWDAARVQVIRTDLGQSGREAVQRQGFQQLLSAVSLGQVGIILGYEVSRLSRNNSDWYRLLEAAAIFDTLIADYDGVYDLNLFNDRLLLGLKGTMSEAELHLIQLRLSAGRKRQLERGVYQQCLPTGYVRLNDGTVLKDPDERVRQTLDLIFTTFRELPSCGKLLNYLCRNDILIPRRQISGVHQGDILWKRPTYGALYEILTIPTYAGTFVYGRRQAQRGTMTRLRKSMDEWKYIHHDIYPAYITWENYLDNQRKLRANRPLSSAHPDSDAGASRQGGALLQGLVFCGKCGHRLLTAYKPYGRYCCHTAKRQYGEPVCDQFKASVIDDVVVAAFFDALQPAQLDALEQVLADQEREYAQIKQNWQHRIRQATYETQRAQRQYNAVDPENRLVAAELERRWEATLRTLQETQSAYKAFERQRSPLELSPELCDQFRHICQTLPALWDELPNSDKKELLRSLVTRVIVQREKPDQVNLKIVWVSGHFSEHSTWIAIHHLKATSHYEQLVARIHDLWQQQLDDQAIAKRLTQEGFTSARLDHISPYTVQSIRMEKRWLTSSSPKIETPTGYLKVAELAERLQVGPHWLYKRIRDGQIEPENYVRHPKRGVILIGDESHIIERIQKLKQT